MSRAARISRRISLRMVMEAVIHGGPISRASIARQTGLSKQTTSEIARILETDGWIQETGRTSGHVGRMATTYEMVPDAALFAAVDLGGTKARTAIADLSCRIVAEEVEPTAAKGGRHVPRQIARMCRTAAQRHDIPFERVRVGVVGVPGVPERDSGRILMAPNIAGLDTFDFASELEDALGMEVYVENDVNLAVQGENWLGAGGGSDNLAFLALGTGIGAGLVLGGQLVRGAAGAAGELGFLPFGTDALSQPADAAGALERIVATDGIRRRYAERSGRQATVPEIFDRADRGDADAVSVLDETAEYLARAIVALCALADPGMVILGGSIGARAELVGRVRALLADAVPTPLRIEPSALGARATIAGAAAVALGHLHNTLFGPDVPEADIALPPAHIIAFSRKRQRRRTRTARSVTPTAMRLTTAAGTARAPRRSDDARPADPTHLRTSARRKEDEPCAPDPYVNRAAAGPTHLSTYLKEDHDMSTYRTLIRRLPALAVAAALAAATPAVAETIGPQGESATPSQTVTVSDAGAATLKGGGHTAALLWHDQSDFVNAVTAGATDEFDRLGIEVIATTNAAFDAAKQRSDIETALVKQPSIILALPLDPVTSAEAFRAAVADGVKLVFLSNLPSGYQHGVDYAAIVTDDLFQMGKQAADALAEAMGGAGTVGWIFHDANYYVTNQRDNAFKTTIENDYPDITIVAEQGISDPARAEEIANAMLLRHPDLGGVYVTWAGPAEGVLASLRASGNKTTRIVTLDLSEPIALDMVQGGNVVAIVADEAYELGRAMAAAGARALLGEETPPFVVAPAITVTADNVAEGWQTSLNRDAPKSVMEAQ